MHGFGQTRRSRTWRGPRWDFESERIQVGKRVQAERRLVSNVWYGGPLGAQQFPQPTGNYSSAVASAWSLLSAAGRNGLIVTSEGVSRPIGVVVLALVSALRCRRSLIILEFLPGLKSDRRGRVIKFLYRQLLHRSSLVIQVMTPWERALYAREYNLNPEVLSYVPFYSYDDGSSRALTPDSARAGVFASGRNSCNWGVLIEAARDRSWGLTLVCSISEYDEVSRAVEGTDIRVKRELSQNEHDELLAVASVYVLPLEDEQVSSGHVRIMSAATFETPVVVTDVRGLDGYKHLAAAVVPPNDVTQLRSAVEFLLNRSEAREEARVRVRGLAISNTRTMYLAAIENLLIHI